MKKFYLFTVFFILLQQASEGMDPSLQVQLDDVNNLYQSIQSTIQNTNTGVHGQTDPALRNQLEDMNHVYQTIRSVEQGGSGSSDLNEQMRAFRNMEQAVKNCNWSSAEYWAKHLLKHEKLSVNQASIFVQLSMIFWNAKQRRKACNCLRYAVSMMDNDRNLGKNCSARAKYFLRKMEAGKLPETFTCQDIERSPGIHCYIMEIPYAVFNNKMQTQIARSEALIGAANAQIKGIQIRSRMEEREAKAYANTEYRAATGKDFDPGHPPRSRIERDAWDSCKRIYDIWDK